MADEGFVFDFCDLKDEEIQLIEVNPYGAMSGCVEAVIFTGFEMRRSYMENRILVGWSSG
jgi:hypothetical protein